MNESTATAMGPGPNLGLASHAGAARGWLQLGPRAPWLLVFVAANVAAAVIMLSTGYLIGDAAEVGATQAFYVYAATAITLLSYLLIAWIMFRFLTRLRALRVVNPPSPERFDAEAKIVGLLLLFLQIGFMIFNRNEGINVAGATNLKAQSGLNWVFVLLQPDIFFFVYYGYYRESRFFKYNLAVFFVSNFLRGWSGFILTIGYFEWCRAYRNGSLRVWKVFAAGLAGLLLYPFVLGFKWYIRSSGVEAFDVNDGVLQVAANVMQSASFMELVGNGVGHLVERLQMVSIVAAIMQSRDNLLDLFAYGMITPFWSEGLPQLAVYRILDIDPGQNLGVMLTDVIAYSPWYELGSWSISPGLVAWGVLFPARLWLFTIYVIVLCVLSVMLAPGSQREGGVRDMLWYAWLIYLIPGWLTAFTGFLCALAVMIALRAICGAVITPPAPKAATAIR